MDFVIYYTYLIKYESIPTSNTREEKRKRSDAVVLQTPLNDGQCIGKVKQTLQKLKITQRLRTNLGRSVGVTPVTPPVWLT